MEGQGHLCVKVKFSLFYLRVLSKRIVVSKFEDNWYNNKNVIIGIKVSWQERQLCHDCSKTSN